MANGDVEKYYKPSNKVAFTMSNVDRFLIDHGAFTIWEKSYLCPCRSNSTNTPSQTCPRCHGAGFALAHPTATVTAIQNQDKNVMNGKDFGLALAGSAIGTVPKEDLVTYRDRLTFPDNLVPQSLLVYVTKKDLKGGIHIRYDVKEVTFASTDEMELPTSQIDIRDSFFYPTQDMVGKYVSINMLVTLRYYVVDILKEARYQYAVGSDPRNNAYQRERVNLPRKLLLRREDMFVPSIINGDGEPNEEVAIDPKRNLENGYEGFFG